ncbi:hypothetical protein PVNG_04356 [Plasmodium vivax North Korean]|uniref:Uncharacterized protein n=1 Tax=Plasmodium vivax North Korean TaxID=1035514 RepID=A0A0J9TUB6_PLAVI|nr:hypothetical protein PVNG_04356 [Plasmodium vivax North Korean]
MKVNKLNTNFIIKLKRRALCLVLLSLLYTYVNKFPEFETIIPNDSLKPTGSEKTNCTSFNDDDLKKYIGENDFFSEKCSRIAEHHDKIIIKAKTSQIALCKYINYWIYDKLQSVDNFSHEDILNSFYIKFPKLKFGGMCNIPIKNKNIYYELKELYDLYDNFIKFKKESTKAVDGSCEKAENVFQLYEKCAGKCKWNYNNYFCWELMKFRAEYEQYLTLHHLTHGYVINYLEQKRKPKKKFIECMNYKELQKWKAGDTNYHTTLHDVPNLNILYNNMIFVKLKSINYKNYN